MNDDHLSALTFFLFLVVLFPPKRNEVERNQEREVLNSELYNAVTRDILKPCHSWQQAVMHINNAFPFLSFSIFFSIINIPFRLFCVCDFLALEFPIICPYFSFKSFSEHNFFLCHIFFWLTLMVRFQR